MCKTTHAAVWHVQGIAGVWYSRCISSSAGFRVEEIEVYNTLPDPEFDENLRNIYSCHSCQTELKPSVRIQFRNTTIAKLQLCKTYSRCCSSDVLVLVLVWY